MEYGSTPYVGMGPEKNGCRIKCVQNKWYVKKSTLHVVISLYEPYQLFSSVFISNKTLSDAGEHH